MEDDLLQDQFKKEWENWAKRGPYVLISCLDSMGVLDNRKVCSKQELNFTKVWLAKSILLPGISD